MFDIPVALIAFNRPAFTAKVLEAVAAVKPTKLFVIADGPRADRPDDFEQCEATRALFEKPQWKCEVLRNYSESNLGCCKRLATGISWVFEHVEQAIILEDDCIPDPTFFRFCDEMLSRYRDDPRVMNISGTIFRQEPIRTPFSYCFSQLPFTWGWATWRRAWRFYDVRIQLWPRLRETSWLATVSENDDVVRYWAGIFDDAYAANGDYTTWDHQWVFSCWLQRGLSILPRENLVSNIGCGDQGTHCLDPNDPTSNLPTTPMLFPLEHPPTVFPDREFDRGSFQEIVRRSIPEAPRLRRRMRALASKLSPPLIKKIYRSLAG